MPKRLFIALLLCLIFLDITANAQKAELVVQMGHAHGVQATAFSKDGKLLATGDTQRGVRIWETATGKLLRSFDPNARHSEDDEFWPLKYAFAFSDDKRYLAVAYGQEDELLVWRISDGELFSEMVLGNAGNGRIESLMFTDRDTKLVAISNDLEETGEKFITAYDTVTGEQIAENLSGSPYLNMLAPAQQINTTISEDFKTLTVRRLFSPTPIFSNNINKEMAPIVTDEMTPYAAVVSLISRDGKRVAINYSDKSVRIYQISPKRLVAKIPVQTSEIVSCDLNGHGNMLLCLFQDGSVRRWREATGPKFAMLVRPTAPAAVSRTDDGNDAELDKDTFIKISPDELYFGIASSERTPAFINVEHASVSVSQPSGANQIHSFQFDENDQSFLFGFGDAISLWKLSGERQSFQTSIVFDRSEKNDLYQKRSIIFSPTAQFFVAFGSDVMQLGRMDNGGVLKEFPGYWETVFSSDSKFLVGRSKSVENERRIFLWDISASRELWSKKIAKHNDPSYDGEMRFSPDGKLFLGPSEINLKDGSVKGASPKDSHDLVEIDGYNYYLTAKGTFAYYDGGMVCTSQFVNMATRTRFVRPICQLTISRDEKKIIGRTDHGEIKILDINGNDILTLIPLGKTDWVVATPDGRFDTNMPLDKILGLHWITSDDPLSPKPLEIFMRQYYEPGLLQRMVKCNEKGNCNTEFKPLPSIAQINTVQPKVVIKEVKPVTDSKDLADITIQVENVTVDAKRAATDPTNNKPLSSGAFDLRLFRDGQLVGVSTAKDKLEKLIADAPRLIAETKTLGKLVNTPEDIAWREANDIFKLKSENLKSVSPGIAQYTFRNIKLPRDGRKEVEFTAYAFNSDRVKSATTTPVKFTIPSAVSDTPKKGRAFLISIGVNASENPAYNLRYAANDADKMQEIIGERLKAESTKYADVIRISLISDYDENKVVTRNAAQKAIVRAVFSLLAGNKNEVQPEILKQIPHVDQISPVEPEDTVIITYSGHGYASQSGMFYLLPYDIGANTRQLNNDVLSRLISSDELSLWMQDITAAEMIMIIDACHSAAAVQGDGFKPGPMGSRGLGQLAYDKDMKIISATQADNVALELRTLRQGLLSFALLQDGVIKSMADSDRNKQLLSTEWLLYGKERVPELYREIISGKRNVVIDGSSDTPTGDRSELISAGNRKSNLNLQRPSVFDFQRRGNKNILFTLR